jgi:hypothetical protein
MVTKKALRNLNRALDVRKLEFIPLSVCRFGSYVRCHFGLLALQACDYTLLRQ